VRSIKIKASSDMTQYVLMQRKCGGGDGTVFSMLPTLCLLLYSSQSLSGMRYQAESDCCWRRVYPSAFVSTEWLGWVAI